MEERERIARLLHNVDNQYEAWDEATKGGRDAYLRMAAAILADRDEQPKTTRDQLYESLRIEFDLHTRTIDDLRAQLAAMKEDNAILTQVITDANKALVAQGDQLTAMTARAEAAEKQVRLQQIILEELEFGRDAR